MIITRYLEFETKIGEVKDITDEVQKALQSTDLNAGIATVFVPGATGAVTTIEYEDGLVADHGRCPGEDCAASDRLRPQPAVA